MIYKFRAYVIFLVGFLAFFSTVCSFSLGEENKPVQMQVEIEDEVLAGEEVKMVVTITNTGENSLLLEKLYIPLMTDVCKVWNESRYGDLSYDSEKDVYIHNTMSQMATPPGFYSILLSPGEYTAVTLNLQFQNEGPAKEILILTYYELTSEQADKYIYYPAETSPLNDIYKPSYQSQGGDFQLESTFVFRYGKDVSFETCEKEFTVNVNPGAYTIKDAFNKLGFRTEKYYYSNWRNCWAIYDGEDLWLVNKNIKEKYKGINLDVFRFIEEQEENVYIVAWEGEKPDTARKELVEEISRKYGGEEYLCYHIYIPKEDVLQVLNSMAEGGLFPSMTDFQLVPAIGVYY